MPPSRPAIAGLLREIACQNSGFGRILAANSSDPEI
jgi:hypothetical protein